MKRLILILIFAGQIAQSETIIDRQAKVCLDEDTDRYASDICKSFRNGIAYARRAILTAPANPTGVPGQLYKIPAFPNGQFIEPVPRILLLPDRGGPLSGQIVR